MPRSDQSRKDARRIALKIKHRKLKQQIGGRRAKRSACYDFNTWMINRVSCHGQDATRALERIINAEILNDGLEKYKLACANGLMPLQTCQGELERIRFESYLLTQKIGRYYERLSHLVRSGLTELGRELAESGKKDEALYEAFNHSLGHRTGDQRSGAAASSDSSDAEDAP